MAVRRLYPMLNGHEVVDKSLSTRDRGGVIIHAPIQMFLLDTTDGWILFDTGANPALVRDAALRKTVLRQPGLGSADSSRGTDPITAPGAPCADPSATSPPW